MRVPASKEGALAGGWRRALPPGPELRSKLEAGWAIGVPWASPSAGCVGPGVEVGGGGVVPAGGGGAEGGPGAGLEVELQVFEGQLGVVLEGGGELAGGGVGGDGAGQLDDHAAAFGFDVEVEEPAFFGVLAGAGGAFGGAEVDAAARGVLRAAGW